MKTFLTKIYNKKILIAVLVIVFLAALIVARSGTKTPVVMNTDPYKGELDVSETKQISINFSSEISERTKSKVSIIFDPWVDFDSTWLSNTYKVVPKGGLKNNTIYKIQILYNDTVLNTFSFETTVFNQEDSKKYGSLQAENDLLFGQALTKLVEEYPFYTRLPIKTKDYVIYYDFDEKKFAITFLSLIKDSAQKTKLISEALSNIKQIGAPEPIKYYTSMGVYSSPSPAP